MELFVSLLSITWLLMQGTDGQVAECPAECLCFQELTPGGTTINCTEQDLNELPTIPSHDAIHKLMLSHNKIMDLKKLKELAHLIELYLDNNDLFEIGIDLNFLVPNLKVMDLSSNDFETVPNQLPQQLDTLYLSNNKIKSIEGRVFEHLNSLTELHLDGNDLGWIDSFSFGSGLDHKVLPSLFKLALNDNKLERIDDGSFIGKHNLKALTISRNNLKILTHETFKGLKNLEYLEINQNKIQSIDNNTFKHLHLLKYLYLSDNHIKKIPHGLPYLDWMDLSHNHIRQVNETVSNNDIYPVEVMNLAHNPLHCDCHMLWLKELWDRREYILKYTDVIDPEHFVPSCASPEYLAGESWDMLGDKVFQCPHKEGDQDHRKRHRRKHESGDENLEYSPFGDPFGDDDFAESNIKNVISNMKSDDFEYPQLHIGVGKITQDTVTIHWRAKNEPQITWVYIQYYIFGQRAESTMFAQVAFHAGRYSVKKLEPETNYIVCVIPKVGDEFSSNTNLDQCVEARTLGPVSWWDGVLDERSITYHIKLIVICAMISVLIVGVGVFFYEFVITKIWPPKEHTD